AQVRRPRAVAEASEQRQLMSPRDGELGEAVQAEHEPVALALLEHVEADPVGAHLDGSAHGAGVYPERVALRPSPSSARPRERVRRRLSAQRELQAPSSAVAVSAMVSASARIDASSSP